MRSRNTFASAPTSPTYQPSRLLAAAALALAIALPLGILLALLLLPLLAAEALAHASYVRSLPEQDARLPRPPTEVTVTFSEAPELRFSQIQVFDVDGSRVDDGQLSLVDPVTLRVGLREIGEGGYTVAWRVLSSVDGHETRGAGGRRPGGHAGDAHRPPVRRPRGHPRPGAAAGRLAGPAGPGPALHAGAGRSCASCVAWWPRILSGPRTPSAPRAWRSGRPVAPRRRRRGSRRGPSRARRPPGPRSPSPAPAGPRTSPCPPAPRRRRP